MCCERNRERFSFCVSVLPDSFAWGWINQLGLSERARPVDRKTSQRRRNQCWQGRRSRGILPISPHYYHLKDDCKDFLSISPNSPISPLLSPISAGFFLTLLANFADCTDCMGSYSASGYAGMTGIPRPLSRSVQDDLSPDDLSHPICHETV